MNIILLKTINIQIKTKNKIKLIRNLELISKKYKNIKILKKEILQSVKKM
jgi:hypothetical protein